MGRYVEDTKLMNVLSNYKVKCKCGHVIIFFPNREKLICSHCGNYVYKNKKIEFKNRILKEKRKLN